jgi:hypothetical protein
MYPWNEPDSGANHHQDQTAPRNGTARHASGTVRHASGGARHANGDDVPAAFTKAVQFALDRRDNGGDAVPASQPATPPTASLTRQ